MKRAFDLLIAMGGLVALSPLLVVIALIVRIRLGSPVLFRQRRPGLNERPFTMVKFRTMRNIDQSECRGQSDEERMTVFGKFLRSSSLDELPELWNVIRGEMSLVGPRPLLMAFLTDYTPEQRRRHEVLPGITGWAQIHGRNNVSWEQKLQLDLWYIENRSFAVDLWILWRTLAQVISREGIEATRAGIPPRLATTSHAEILTQGDVAR
jgi:lipopolysaccharide/colanic/teichoic acid biosynthesis glycosyltransferase